MRLKKKRFKREKVECSLVEPKYDMNFILGVYALDIPWRPESPATCLRVKQSTGHEDISLACKSHPEGVAKGVGHGIIPTMKSDRN
jgi:hypothetical protein